MGNSTQQEMVRQGVDLQAWWAEEYARNVKRMKGEEPTKHVALIGWGLRHDLGESADPAISVVMEMLEKKGLGIQIANGNLQAWSPTDREVRGDLAKQLKGRGVQTAIFFVARSNQELQLAWGDLSIAGIELWLVPIEGFNSTPMPCTMRYKGEKEIGSHPLEAGRWVKHQVAGVTAYRWKEPRWTFDELASTTFPFGSVIMWKASDYDEMWQPVFVADVMEETIREANQTAWTGLDLLNRRYFRLLEKYSMCQQAVDHTKPLSPPEGISYPHILNLEGYRFCEVPLRYIDYLVGQPWIYGEFAQRLRQYHAHPLIQEDLHKKFTPWTETVGGKGVPADRRNLESDTTGYWDNHDRYVSTMCQDTLVLLSPRDRFGNKLKGKAAYNETLTDHVARRLEQLGYEDILEQPTWRWCQAVPWAFDEYAPETKDGQFDPANLEPVLDLEEEPDFQRDPRKQRFPYQHIEMREEDYYNSIEMIKDKEKLIEKNERNAWYTALDLSEQLSHLQQRARAAQTPEDWNPADVYGEKRSLLEEFRDITLQVTPLLIKMLGMGVREWLYQQAKEVLADVKRAAHRTHEDAYVQGIIDVLEEEPKVASKLVDLSSVMPEVVEDILAQCPELVSDEIKDAVKAAKKRRASLFPELYTQKGTRRVRCAHDKVTA